MYVPSMLFRRNNSKFRGENKENPVILCVLIIELPEYVQ